MRSHPFVVVHAPDGRGLRAVSAGGKAVGSAWSERELRRVLGRAGVPRDSDLGDRARVLWPADRDDWPDRPWRRRATGAVMALGLLASAAVLLRVRLTDAFHALAYGGPGGALRVGAGALRHEDHVRGDRSAGHPAPAQGG